MSLLSEDNIKGKHPVTWTENNENIMIEWCDVAKCYKWMHARSHSKYARYNMWFTIPSIILSTISGTASFAQGSMSGTTKNYAPMAIGTVNIAVGIINTLQQFFKLSQLQESHRISSIAWDKFERNIRIEIAKIPDERIDANIFFKQTRNEYDRLMESSPSIPMKVIREFMKEAAGEKGTKQEKYFQELKKPEICNTIISSKHAAFKRVIRERRDSMDAIEAVDTIPPRSSSTDENV